MNAAERIKDLLKERDLSALQLAKKAKLAPTTVYSLLDRDSNPYEATLEAICSAFEMTVAEFYSGSYLPPDLAEKETRLLASFRRISEQQQDAFLLLLEGLERYQ